MLFFNRETAAYYLPIKHPLAIQEKYATGLILTLLVPEGRYINPCVQNVYFWHIFSIVANNNCFSGTKRVKK